MVSYDLVHLLDIRSVAPSLNIRKELLFFLVLVLDEVISLIWSYVEDFTGSIGK
jgi:hypothetical protein